MIDTPIIDAIASPRARNRYAGAAQRRCDISSRESRDWAESTGNARRDESEAAQNCRRDGGHGEQQQEERDESREQASRREHDDQSERRGEQKADPEQPAGRVYRSLLDNRTTQTQ